MNWSSLSCIGAINDADKSIGNVQEKIVGMDVFIGNVRSSELHKELHQMRLRLLEIASEIAKETGG